MNEQFLFILDNCDSIKDTTDYLNLIIQDSALINVKFLITTRIGSPLNELDSNTMGYIRNCSLNIEIEAFNENESIEFIKYFLKDETTSEEELNEFLSIDCPKKEKFRPIIFNKLIALAKLKIDSNCFSNWIEENKNNHLKQNEALYDELFVNLIEKDKSWKVIKQCSVLDSDFSPISIYTGLLDFDENELEEARKSLIRLSLITIEEDDEGMEYGIKMHRTLQNEIKQYLEIK